MTIASPAKVLLLKSQASGGMSSSSLLSLLNPSRNLLLPLQRPPQLPWHHLSSLPQTEEQKPNHKIFHQQSPWITGLMGWREALFWKPLMLLLLDRRLIPLLGEGLLGGPTVDMLLLTPLAPDLVPERGLEAGLEKDPIVPPALCQVVQSQTPSLLDLGLDHTLHLGKGIVPVTVAQRAVPALRPVPPLDPLSLCPAPLPGGGGDTRILPLVPAHGVAPDHGLDRLRDERGRVEAEDCTAHTEKTMATGQTQT